MFINADQGRSKQGSNTKNSKIWTLTVNRDQILKIQKFGLLQKKN